VAASALVRPLSAAPDLDGWAIVERLLADLGALEARVWLVVDDVHELAAAEALAHLELLVIRGPPQLRFVLATRHDLRLGLHRLRLEGELTEIRADDLRFTLEEARALFEAAGVALSDEAVALLHERTEGWAAGLRLAALSLAGHPDPERFAEEFSGSERTVADYLLAEVLERQSEPVRRLLLRTSVLERISGELADLLTGGSGGELILQDLEKAGAFVVSLDARRSWFRYHRLFADLLQLELRGTAPAEVPALHAAAAGWFAGNGYPFLLHPAPGLLRRHARRRSAHAALIADILGLLPGGNGQGGFGAIALPGLTEPLSPAETRVLRYLPTGLSVAEIAGQLYLSVNTVRTHMRHVYDKLGAHRRHEAVERARALGLLAPSTRRP
jgi:ATP/maltotriose-dependent transcriptional regulator MalT